MRKILISAYGCEPHKGSEQGVGWNWVLELAKTEELWVITRANNQASIEMFLPPQIKKNVHFLYCDLPAWLGKAKKKEKGLYFYYLGWQWIAYLRARKISKQVKFDYCIHLTFGSFWMPIFMHLLKVPFVWGPVGGGECVPFAYIKKLPFFDRFFQYLRYLLIRFANIYPFFFGPANAAKAIIVRTEDSKKVFSLKFQEKTRVLLETGISSELLSRYERQFSTSNSETIRLVYSGRLVAFKNVEMAIRALAATRQLFKPLHLTIVGDGPMRGKLEKLSQQLNIRNQITFTGSVSQSEAIQILKGGDIFLFPSLREGGSWALMEAMAVGLPVICMDTTGMHVITDETCAVRIPPTSFDDSIHQMSEAICRLAESRELRYAMGDRARKRIEEEFTWEKKGLFIQKLLAKLDK